MKRKNYTTKNNFQFSNNFNKRENTMEKLYAWVMNMQTTELEIITAKVISQTEEHTELLVRDETELEFLDTVENVNIKGFVEDSFDHLWFTSPEEAIEDYERTLDGDSMSLIFENIWEEDDQFEKSLN